MTTEFPPPTPAAWTWVDADPAGEPLPMLLLAHPAGLGMAELAVRLGLAAAEAPVAELGELLTVCPGAGVTLGLGAAELPVPAHPQWTRLLLVRRHAALIVGLDPLPRTADLPDVDRYLTAALADRRLLFGHAYGAHAQRRATPLPRGGTTRRFCGS
ncbi:MAG: hypothetical protein QOF84_6836 [Streptomyces sp.]|nr:hypothetical protein [Streptomyces sp.]